MKLVTMTAACAMAAMMAAACSAEMEQQDSDVGPIAPSTVTPDQINNGGGPATKKKSDLEADGYTCSHLEGTSLTLCWKGSSTYSCDDNGNCIETAQRPPTRPIVVRPIGTVSQVLAP